VKQISYILAFIFTAFLCTPSVIALIDSSVDISIAYNVNEEENSSKNQISLEYTIEEMDSNDSTIHFLQIRKQEAHKYRESLYRVFLSILSPPPKLA